MSAPTKGDLELLKSLHQYKILTINQLSALSQRSAQVIRRRVRSLHAKNIVNKRDRSYGRRRGRPEEVIFLSKEGLELLGKKGDISNEIAHDPHEEINTALFEHDLLVNWFRIHLFHLSIAVPQLLIDYPSSNLDLIPLRSDDRRGDGKGEFRPDGVFTITDKKTKKTLLFFLEVDMGTETLSSANRNHKDLRQKITNYQDVFRTKRYKRCEKNFDAKLKGFRLLFLANTATRLTALCRLVQETPPSDFVWLTDANSMFSRGLPANIWVRGGQNNSLAESIIGPKLACDAPIDDAQKAKDSKTPQSACLELPRA